MPRLDASPGGSAGAETRTLDVLGPRGLLLVGSCLAAAGVAALADAAGEHDGPSRVDPVAAADVLRLRTPTLTHVAMVFTFLGSEVVVGTLAIGVLVLLLARRKVTRAAVFAFGIGGAAFLTVAVKLLVARPRPGGVDRLGPVDTTYSFPSGHTLNTAVFLALVVWLLWTSVTSAGRVALVAAAAVAGIGVAASRIYLGYHWFTDILASGLVAAGWLCVVWMFSGLLHERVRTWSERAG